MDYIKSKIISTIIISTIISLLISTLTPSITIADSFFTSSNIIIDEYPKNQSTNIGLIPHLIISISNTYNNSLLMEWWSNDSGEWKQFSKNVISHDSKIQIMNQNFSKINSTYFWSINISDGNDWINKSYWFKTQIEPFNKKWERKIDYYSWSPLVAEDIDNDGSYEIFIGGRNGSRYENKTISNGLVSIDGISGIIEWDRQIDFDGLYMPCAIDDLNNDGSFEIVHSSGDRTIVHNCEDGSELWNVSIPSAWGQIAIAQFDDNNYPYVFVGSNTVHESNPSIKKLFGNNGTLAKSNDIIQYTCHGGISIADIDLNGDFEIIISDSGRNYCFNQDLELLWSTTPYSSESHAPIIKDVVGDGRLEVIFLEQDNGFPADGGIHVYSADGTEIPSMNDGSLGLGCHSQPTIFDIDKDGHVEVITSNFISSYGATNIKVWDLIDWSLDATLEKSAEPPNCANVIGDDNFEIVSCAAFTDDVTNIYNSQYQIEFNINDFGTSTITQDIDNDGLNEIVFNKPKYNNRYDHGIITTWDTAVSSMNQRTDTSHYSERRTSVSEYIPKIGKKCFLSNIYPANNRDDVPVKISEVSVKISEPDNDSFFWSIESVPDVGSDNGWKNTNSYVSCEIKNLEYNTTYNLFINCSDGTNWLREQFSFTTEQNESANIPSEQYDNYDNNNLLYTSLIVIFDIVLLTLYFYFSKRKKN